MKPALIVFAFALVGFHWGMIFGLWLNRPTRRDKYRMEVARLYFGNDWRKAIRECDDAHFPGDCVLCQKQASHG